MRYSLLDFLACPRCAGQLTCVTVAEVPATPPEGNYDVIVETGVLSCAQCAGWYPVIGSLPELLPDHLRDWDRDREWLNTVKEKISAAQSAAWRAFTPKPDSDSGAHHKLAEIALPSKISDDSFWGPGYASPFNLWNPEHSWHLIRNFAIAEPLLELSRGQVVLDAGAGYAWTTEWLLRSGYEAIGIDICRAYLSIALERIGVNRPHLIVADVEHLPIKSERVDAVLGFEAFHHVPNRPTAMREFARVLRDGKPVVLVEPGGEHEHATVSVEAMAQFGTLEKGMELSDVVRYAEGSGLSEYRQHYIIRATYAPAHVAPLVRPVVANNVYTLRKGDASVSAPASMRAQARQLVKRSLWRIYDPLHVTQR